MLQQVMIKLLLYANAMKIFNNAELYQVEQKFFVHFAYVTLNYYFYTYIRML